MESRTRHPTLLRSLFRTGDNVNPSFWMSKEDSKVSGQIWSDMYAISMYITILHIIEYHTFILPSKDIQIEMVAVP